MRTVGVEEELLLFDAASSRPAPIGQELAEQSPEVEHEFKLQQAEIASEPHQDLGELADNLRTRRREVADAAAARGARVAALGSSPIGAAADPTPDDRYLHMHDLFGHVAHDQLACGAHVHVSIDSRAEGVQVLDGIRSWLPVLTAMCANSPFWQGADTQYASFRSVAWGRWPTAGPIAALGSVGAYEALVADLISSGAALDNGMIYFDARLSASYPTVEIRVADVGQEVEDDVLLAALCRALVDRAASGELATDARVEVVRAAAWRAARFGLGEQLWDVAGARLRPAWDLVDRFVDTLAPSLRASGDRASVDALLTRLRERGTGTDLQRADHALGGSPEVVRRATERAVAEPPAANSDERVGGVR